MLRVFSLRGNKSDLCQPTIMGRVVWEWEGFVNDYERARLRKLERDERV